MVIRSCLFVPVTLAAMLVAASACKTREFNSPDTGSGVKEAPNAYNLPSALGITGSFNWDDIKNHTKAEIGVPWSDTYWPLAKKGVAARYIKTSGLTLEPKSFLQQIEEYQRAVKSGDLNSTVGLSPAEKWDLLTKGTVEIPKTVMTKLEKTEKQSYLDVMKLKTEAMAVSAKISALEFRNADLRASIAVLPNWFGNTDKMKRELERNLGEIEDLREQLDSLNKKMASTGGKATARDIAEASEALSKYMPLTAEGWGTFSEYMDFKGDWNWMGLCHGWAPASIMEQTPKHSVLVKSSKGDILFTEGDIRGLLTKVWAGQGPEKAGDTYFGGLRCNTNKETYSRNARNRINDGMVCEGRSSGKCTNGKVIHFKSFIGDPNNPQGVIYDESARGKSEKTVKIMIFNRGLDTDLHAGNVYSYREFEEAEGNVSSLRGTEAVVQLSVRCRDTNAMLFHLALTKLLAEKKVGFVMDVTRSSEVWNQAAHKYELQYLPVQLMNGKVTQNGKPVTNGNQAELVPVSEVKDAFRVYRAKGKDERGKEFKTEYLLQVEAILHYGVEYGPLPHYEAKDDHTKAMHVVYTLEFDKNKNLIGGEWGPIPNERGEIAKKNTRALEYIGGDNTTPDFLWYYKDTAKPSAGPIDYALLKKIHECSLSGTASKTANVGGQQIRYSECHVR